MVRYIFVVSIFSIFFIFRCLINFNDIRIKKLYITAFMIVLFLISALKSVNFTSDILQYSLHYVRVSEQGWKYLFLLLLSGKDKDVTYVILSKIFSSLGFSYFVFFACIAAFYFYSLGKFILQYSKEPFLSIVIFISLGHFYFSMTALRQSIAIAILFFALDELLHKKNMKFIMLTLVASLFHLSALVFCIALPLTKIKKVPWSSLLYIPAFVVGSYLVSATLKDLWITIAPKQYAIYSSIDVTLTLSNVIIVSSLSFFTIFFGKQALNKDPEVRLYLLLLLVSIIPFTLSSYTFAEMFRVGYYFSIFAIILIPNVLAERKKRVFSFFLYFGILVAFFLYFFSSSAARLILTYDSIF